MLPIGKNYFPMGEGESAELIERCEVKPLYDVSCLTMIAVNYQIFRSNAIVSVKLKSSRGRST